MVTFLVIIVAAAGIILLLRSGKGTGKSSSWLQFYAKGKDSGFSIKEIDLLRRLAVKSNLEDPSSLFWSQNQLDICIRSLVRNLHVSGGGNAQESNDFLSKLYDFRKKIEMNKPRIKNGISSSREIGDDQQLRILVEGIGVFKSRVIRNAGNYMTISRPVMDKQTGFFSWANVNISVYFWREDDAGYVFDSTVEDEVFSKGLASLKINHSDSLFRTQKRKSIRVKLHKSAFLYLLDNDEDAHKLEVNHGLKCFLADLSDTGCAVTIGGKANEGLRIKVQFALNNSPIVMPGTVRSVTYNEEQDRSLLHVEADPLPIEIRNKILGEVFGMLPEEEDDLPFRILEDEVDNGEINSGMQEVSETAPSDDIFQMEN